MSSVPKSYGPSCKFVPPPGGVEISYDYKEENARRDLFSVVPSKIIDPLTGKTCTNRLPEKSTETAIWVDPEMSERMLRWAVRNRPISDNAVEELAEEWEKGNYSVNGSPLRCCWYGRVLDGNTRLLTSIRHRLAFRTFVTVGLDPAIMPLLDNERSRTAAGNISVIFGEMKNATNKNACLKLIDSLVLGRPVTRKRTNRYMSDLFRLNFDNLCRWWYVLAEQKGAGIVTAGVPAACSLYRKAVELKLIPGSLKKVDEFAFRVATGLKRDNEFDPESRLYDLVCDSAHTDSDAKRYKVMLKAFTCLDAKMQGESIEGYLCVVNRKRLSELSHAFSSLWVPATSVEPAAAL